MYCSLDFGPESSRTKRRVPSVGRAGTIGIAGWPLEVVSSSNFLRFTRVKSAQLAATSNIIPRSARAFFDITAKEHHG